VTGASRGIGRAVAQRLLDLGASVGLVGRDRTALEAVAAGALDRACVLVADLSEREQRAALVAQAVASLGSIDALVQCAGIARHRAVGAITESDIAEQIEVNLVAPLLLAQDVAVHMRERGIAGSIVNVASTLGIRPAARTTVYAATKAGLIAMTQALAVELAADGIRVNAVAPGVIDTDMIRGARDGAELEALRRLHPLGRLGTAEDVAAGVLHLLDATFVTGSVLVVDGGLLAG